MASTSTTKSKERRTPTMQEEMAEREAWDRRMQQREREAELEKRHAAIMLEDAQARYQQASPPSNHDAANDPLSPQRYDGWTMDRQRQFFAAIADGLSVRDACALVGMSEASAYAFRRRNGGSAFALGWQTASLFSRDAIADQLHERAMAGVPEIITLRDGTRCKRIRYDNRLAMAMLTRLDQQADQLLGNGAGTSSGSAPVQVIARHWDEFLAFIAQAPDSQATAQFVAERLAADAPVVGALPAPADAEADIGKTPRTSQLPQLRSQASVSEKKKIKRFPAWMKVTD